MKIFKMFVSAVAVLICGEMGCDLRPFEAAKPKDAGPVFELPDLRIQDPVLQEAGIRDRDSGIVMRPDAGWPSRVPGFYIRDAGNVVDAAKDSEDGTGEVEDEWPTAILIRTCESEPDEVAVTHPTKGNHSCEVIQATAYRADDEGSYEVSAEYSWQVQDQQVAFLDPNDPYQSVRHPIALKSILEPFPLDQEPETEFVVCVQPLGGWPAGHGPLCRVLPIRGILNLRGPWCFSGTSFLPDCDFIQIEQDGRMLKVEPDGPGSIWGKEVHFYRNGLYYEAELSDSEYMSGAVYDPYTDTLLGTWSAYKYTM